ncbi:hypothetical protein ACFWJ4_26385 [Kitasatospora sp. NPDC127067]|uniref:hypothetical protein n=1 Tax=Kitasatospora sp. NPDC127067 TaxID=3347126 RepID=UPI003659B3B8
MPSRITAGAEANVHLLAEHSAGRYRFHDLVRLFAAERAALQESEHSRGLARRRWYAWCLRHAWAAALDLYRELPEHYRGPVALLTSLGFTPPGGP